MFSNNWKQFYFRIFVISLHWLFPAHVIVNWITIVDIYLLLSTVLFTLYSASSEQKTVDWGLRTDYSEIPAPFHFWTEMGGLRAELLCSLWLWSLWLWYILYHCVEREGQFQFQLGSGSESIHEAVSCLFLWPGGASVSPSQWVVNRDTLSQPRQLWVPIMFK